MITLESLREVMFYQIKNLGTIEEPDLDTVHKDALGNENTPTSPVRVYEDFIKLTLRGTGVSNSKINAAWPSDWLNQTIGNLSTHIISKI